MTPEVYNAVLLAVCDGIGHILGEPRVLRDSSSVEELREYLHEALPLPGASKCAWMVEARNDCLLVGVQGVLVVRIRNDRAVERFLRASRQPTRRNRPAL